MEISGEGRHTADGVLVELPSGQDTCELLVNHDSDVVKVLTRGCGYRRTLLDIFNRACEVLLAALGGPVQGEILVDNAHHCAEEVLDGKRMIQHAGGQSALPGEQFLALAGVDGSSGRVVGRVTRSSDMNITSVTELDLQQIRRHSTTLELYTHDVDEWQDDATWHLIPKLNSRPEHANCR
jgi:hypothetical protein